MHSLIATLNTSDDATCRFWAYVLRRLHNRFGLSNFRLASNALVLSVVGSLIRLNVVACVVVLAIVAYLLLHNNTLKAAEAQRMDLREPQVEQSKNRFAWIVGLTSTVFLLAMLAVWVFDEVSIRRKTGGTLMYGGLSAGCYFMYMPTRHRNARPHHRLS